MLMERIGKLQGILSRYAKGKVLTKQKIEEVTEKGFVEGYRGCKLNAHVSTIQHTCARNCTTIDGNIL